MMKTFFFSKKLIQRSQNWLVSILFLFGLTLFSTVFLPSSLTANAATLNSPQLLSTVSTINEAKEEAGEAFNNVFGAGSTDQVEGNFDKAVGKTQQNLRGADNTIEGAAKRVKGKVQSDIGATKGKAQEAAEDTGNVLERIFGD